MNAAVGIIRSKEKFPCKLSQDEGEILKEYFIFDKKVLNEQNDLKNLKYIYKLEVDGNRYILLEEFMFKDGDSEIDINKAIGSNYYLNKI